VCDLPAKPPLARASFGGMFPTCAATVPVSDLVPAHCAVSGAAKSSKAPRMGRRGDQEASEGQTL
ncbi:hypothetical protein P7K49_011965, partial [Saguinus oedipus]